VEEAIMELMNKTPLPSFANFDPDTMIDVTVPVWEEKSCTWNECLASCDIIRQFLVENDMLSLKRISTATSQLSIKSFS
jgi:hypothetical protein